MRGGKRRNELLVCNLAARDALLRRQRCRVLLSKLPTRSYG